MGVAFFLPSCFQELGLRFGVGIRLGWVGSGAHSVARGRQGTLLDSPLPLTLVWHEMAMGWFPWENGLQRKGAWTPCRQKLVSVHSTPLHAPSADLILMPFPEV